MGKARDVMIVIVALMVVFYAVTGLGITTKCQEVAGGFLCQHRAGFVFKNFPIREQE